VGGVDLAAFGDFRIFRQGKLGHSGSPNLL
jgi:hypothetical protein